MESLHYCEGYVEVLVGRTRGVGDEDISDGRKLATVKLGYWLYPCLPRDILLLRFFGEGGGVGVDASPVDFMRYVRVHGVVYRHHASMGAFGHR